jgi:chemotaxis family two-component system sensor kinase Cph1
MHPERKIGEKRQPADLDQSAREVQKFLQGAVHDLRAALRGVGVTAEILRNALEGQIEGETNEAFQRLLAGVSTMNVILAGISSYSTALPADYTFRSLPVEAALRSALRILDARISETGAVVTKQGALPRVSGDWDRITELFQHLIGNAIRYRSAEPPRIEIQAQRNQDDWLLSVRDNGIGIDPKHTDMLFVPFRRLHGSEIPGVGLGLAICKKIVEAHRGKIWVESAAEKGSTFFFTLPGVEG